jgi:hypothetical protein
MITAEVKQQITEGLKTHLGNYKSASKMAIALDISGSQLSRVLGGDNDQVLSDAKWISIARRLEIHLGAGEAWKTARTEVFEYVTGQLGACQDWSISGILCDEADTGKTHAGMHYAREHKNAVYIDCSQVKSRQNLIRLIAKEFGVDNSGTYKDVYETLVYYLRSIKTPLVVLDEAGDLDYPAFLEIKALWNATERRCGWFMMGADALRVKIERNKDHKKVGYAEIFRRFGGRFQRVSPEGREALEDFNRKQVALIAAANGSKIPGQEMFRRTGGSLTRIFIEIKKTA